MHERQSDLAGAISSLKAYLEAAPQGEHAETVKLRIQNLEKRQQEQEAAKPPAPTSTVLTGGALLGVGLGVALLLTSGAHADVGSTRPRFNVAVGPRAAAAAAEWAF